jgi:hypothetical protein
VGRRRLAQAQELRRVTKENDEMESTRFDTFARRLAGGHSRRTVLGGLLGGGAAAALGGGAGRAQEAAPAATPTAVETLSWLLTLEFERATIAVVERESGPQGMVTVTLTGVGSEALAFTDRPARGTAEWSIDRVMDAIASGFAGGDPLNASLSARLPDIVRKLGLLVKFV